MNPDGSWTAKVGKDNIVVNKDGSWNMKSSSQEITVNADGSWTIVMPSGNMTVNAKASNGGTLSSNDGTSASSLGFPKIPAPSSPGGNAVTPKAPVQPK